jgi:NADPH:quinone reductase-like Zn-dependent oxidoreductase
MKAIIQERYGPPDVLKLRDIDTPLVKDHEVLVRVRAAAVNQADCYFMTGVPYIMRVVGSGMGFGLRGPKTRVRGRDVAGQVEAVGKDVTRFRPGDEVYGEIETGSFAEYTTVPESMLALKPANLTFEQAAAVPLSANTALQGLRDVGKIQPGQKVLIIGTSGGVGTFAVQIAKAFGAEVTGVCSTSNVELAHSLGADHVIDYTQEDFTQHREKYDLIFQAAGMHSPSECRRALTPTGTLVLSSGQGNRWLGPLGRMARASILSLFVSQNLRVHAASPDKDDLAVLKELIEDGMITPAIDRTYPLSEAAEAIRYVQEGHAHAKVVIIV